MKIVSFFSELGAWYRLLLVASAIWIIGVLIAVDPWTKTSRRGGTYSNWDDFFGLGVMPVVAAWGIIWIVHGFKRRKDDGKNTKSD